MTNDEANHYLGGVMTVVGLTAFVAALTAAWFHTASLMSAFSAFCIVSWVGAVLATRRE